MKHISPPQVENVRYFVEKSLRDLCKKLDADATKFRPAATQWLDALQACLAYRAAREGAEAMLRSMEEGSLDALLESWIIELYSADPRDDRDQT